jgi:hypothetical protein
LRSDLRLPSPNPPACPILRAIPPDHVRKTERIPAGRQKMGFCGRWPPLRPLFRSLAGRSLFFGSAIQCPMSIPRTDPSKTQQLPRVEAPDQLTPQRVPPAPTRVKLRRAKPQTSPETCADTTVLNGAKRVECVCFSTAFARDLTDQRGRKAAVNRTHSTRFATPPPHWPRLPAAKYVGPVIWLTATDADLQA